MVNYDSKNIKKGIDIIFMEYSEKEARDLLLEFFRGMGKISTKNFSDERFSDYINKKEKML